MQTGTLTCNGAVNLILADGGKLTATGYNSAAIFVSGASNSLTVYAQSTDAAQMGTLIANGVGGSAGIGGRMMGSGSNITINDGAVIARGGVELWLPVSVAEKVATLPRTSDGQDGGNAFVAATAGWCQEATSILSFKTLTGDPIEYSVKFSDEAKAQGFEDVEWEAIVDGNKIVIDIPVDCKDGVYNATVCLRNELGISTDPIDDSIKVLVNSNTVVALFSDVIAVDNIYDN